MRFASAAVVGLLVPLAAPCGALAQPYPSRTITSVAGFAPGGATTWGRVVQEAGIKAR